MKNKILIFLLGLIGTALSPLHSQEAVDVTLSAISLDGRVIGAVYDHNGQSQEVNIFRKQRSGTFRYSGPPTFNLYRETGQLDEQGNPVRQVIAQTKIPRASGQYLLILSRVSESPERYRILPILDDWNSFKAGSYRFLNLAPFEIVIKINKDIFRIKESGFTDINAALNDKEHHQTMMVSIPEDGKPVPIFEGFLYHQENKRMLYIASPKGDPQSGKVRIIGISDVVPRQQPAGGTAGS